MKQSVNSNKIIEEKRIALSLRFDFNLRELYSMADTNKTGIVVEQEFSKFIDLSLTKLSKLERVLVLDKYSSRNDSS